MTQRDDKWFELTIKYDDEFAPSEAKFSSTDPSLEHLPAHRLLAYNDHLDDTLQAIIIAASSYGLPILPVSALTFVNVQDKNYAEILGHIGELIPKLEEGSCGWLAVHCYLSYVEANYLATTNGPMNLLANAMFKVGAACREFELTALNRRNAHRGATTARSSSEGGIERKRSIQPQLDERHRLLEELLAQGKNQSEAAQIVVKRLGLSIRASSVVKTWRKSRG